MTFGAGGATRDGTSSALRFVFRHRFACGGVTPCQQVVAYPEMHPQSACPTDDLEHFVGKINAGANAAITQYFLMQRLT